MPTTYTSLIGLAKPQTGELAGTWGDVVNDYLTTYVDAAVAGSQVISGSQTSVDLTVANGTALVQVAGTSSGSAQYRIIRCTGNPAGTLTITAPADSRAYVVINATSTNQSVVVRGSGPTTGVTIPSLTRALVAWNGTDYALVASNRITDLTGTLATTNGGTGLTSFTANGAVYATSTSALTTGTLPVSSGGTGAATLTANNVLLGNGTSALQVVSPSTSGNLLLANGTTWGSNTVAGLGINKLINGRMNITQRDTTFASPASNAYTLDRWQISYSTSATVTVLQDTDVPSNNEFYNSLRISVTAADTSIAAGDYTIIRQLVEGYNIRDLIGRTFTLSFWVRSTKTGTHCVSFSNINDRAYVLEYTVNASNTWEYKTLTVSGGLITAGNWSWINGIGLRVAWALACGTTFQTTAGAWQTGVFLATSNQVNCLDSTSNTFAITGAQLELGAVATPFEHRQFGQEVALCQRYYSKSYSLTVNPATITAAGQYREIGVNNSVAYNVAFPVEMRAAPTATVYSPATGATGVVRDVAAAADIAVTGSDISTRGMNFYQTSAVSNNGYVLAHWVVSSEL
jgi:hypothetical protein